MIGATIRGINQAFEKGPGQGNGAVIETTGVYKIADLKFAFCNFLRIRCFVIPLGRFLSALARRLHILASEMNPVSFKILYQLIRDTFRDWSEDKVPRMGAAIAYYSVFSMAPLILTAIGIAALVFGRDAAQG